MQLRKMTEIVSRFLRVGQLAARTLVTCFAVGSLSMFGPKLVQAQASVTFIEYPPNIDRIVANSLSPDGEYVVGQASDGMGTQYGFIWSKSNGFEYLPSGFLPVGVSENAEVILGNQDNYSTRKSLPALLRKTSSGYVLESIGQECDGCNTYLTGLSGDGSTSIGYISRYDPGEYIRTHIPVFWLNSQGLSNPLPLDADEARTYQNANIVRGVSKTGQSMTGLLSPTAGTGYETLPVYWPSPTSAPIYLSTQKIGNRKGHGHAVSGDGQVVGGAILSDWESNNGFDCFRWTAETGLVQHSIEPGLVACNITDIDFDGSVMVGHGPYRGGIIWRADRGLESLRLFLENEYGLREEFEGIDYFTEFMGLGVSDDGKVILGDIHDKYDWSSGQLLRPHLTWIADLRTWSLVDPVPELLDGAAITDDPIALSSKGRVVRGVSADGVAQLVVRYKVTQADQGAFVTVVDEDKEQLGSVADLGAICSSQDDPQEVGESTIYIDPVQTSEGLFLLAKYIAPIDFVRQNSPSEDIPRKSRRVFLRFQFQNGNTEFLPIDVVRPPVVLVHGTYSSPAAWDDAHSLLQDSRFMIKKLDYSGLVDPDLFELTIPSYSRERRLEQPVKENVLGVDYNAPRLFRSLKDGTLAKFREGVGTPTGFRVAAIQYDVIAHSLGNLMVRGMRRLKYFFNSTNYEKGFFHKFIALGGTHLGTHLAKKLMAPENHCSRDAGSVSGTYNLELARVGGKNYNGATFDQQGDGSILGASETIQSLHQPLFLPRTTDVPVGELPTAFVVAILDSSNSSVVVDAFGSALHFWCRDPFSSKLSIATWRELFDGSENDAVVPFASAVSGQTNYSLFRGVAHGVGSIGTGTRDDPHLGFWGTHMLEDASGVPARVLELLDASIYSDKFASIP